MYRAKKYAEACALFKQASEIDPTNGAVFADLGLCLAKLGDKTQAIAANRRAVETGEPATRKNAYFNLDRLGVKVALPKAGACGPLAEDQSPHPFHACAYAYEAGGSGIVQTGEAVRIAVSADLAKADLPTSSGPPSLGEIERSQPTEGFLGVAATDLVLSETAEDRCLCDEHDVGCMKGCEARRATTRERTNCSVVYARPPFVGLVCRLPGAKAPVTKVLEVLVAVEQ